MSAPVRSPRVAPGDSLRRDSLPLSRLRHSRAVRGDDLRRSLFWTLVAWIPGAFWVASTLGGTATILACDHFGASSLWIGIMTAAPLLGALLQLPGALIVEWLGRRKTFFVWTVSAHRLLYVVIGLLPWFMPAASTFSAAVMVLLILLSLGLHNFGGQAWVNWMADLVPPRIRGKYFAKRSRVGYLVMVLTAIGLGLALDGANTAAFGQFVAPVANWSGLRPLILLISVVFILAGLVGTLDILGFLYVDEPPMQRADSEPLHQRLLKPLRDRQFLGFCAYWSLWMFATAFASAFWWLYVLSYFKQLETTGAGGWFVEHQYLMMFFMLPVGYQVGNILGFPIWGRAVDRFGRKPVLFVSSTLQTATWGCWIFLSPATLIYMPLVQVVGGMLGAGQEVGSFNMLLQFNRKGGTGYQALGSIIFSVAGAAGAVLSGKLQQYPEVFTWTFAPETSWAHTFDHYATLIMVAMLLKYAADMILLPYVHDLDARPRRETVRFVFENLYGTLNTVVFSPLLTGIGATRDRLSEVTETITENVGGTFKKWFR